MSKKTKISALELTDERRTALEGIHNILRRDVSQFVFKIETKYKKMYKTGISHVSISRTLNMYRFGKCPSTDNQNQIIEAAKCVISDNPPKLDSILGIANPTNTTNLQTAFKNG